MNGTREQVAWAAGLFEGEGSMSAHNKSNVSLVLATTDRDVIERFREVVGCGRVRADRRRRREHHKICWYWQASARDDVRAILEAFLPWFGQRRAERAREMLDRVAANPGPRGQWTHCKRGHPLSGANLFHNAAGSRGCLTCRRLRRSGQV